MNIKKADIAIWLPRLVFLGFISVFLANYVHYLASIVSYPYDWEPTDGDHLNFARRIAQGLPIYLKMSEGGLLSIYSPLYHILLALIGGESATMEIGRSLSLVAWSAVPLAIFVAYRKEWGWYLAFACAIFTWLPTQSMMLVDMVQVNQNSLMATLFVASLLTAERAASCERNASWMWALTGAFACLAFFAKQQGIVAPLSVIAYLFLQGRSLKTYLWVAAGGVAVFVPLTTYLELANHGQFLQVTLLDLSRIMITAPELARMRLFDFLVKFNPAFLVATIVSFWIARKSPRHISIWQIGILLNILLLSKTLGNGGGGNNYLAPLWIAMCVATVGAISRLYAAGSLRPKFIAECLLVAVMFNAGIGSIIAREDLEQLGEPTQAMEAASKRYYEDVSRLIAARPSAPILVNRNVGAVVYAGADVRYEGSTIFNYAWNFPEKYPRNFVINNIRSEKYDFITTGIQPYPPDVQHVIDAHYSVAISANTNVIFSGWGTLEVLVPNRATANVAEQRN